MADESTKPPPLEHATRPGPTRRWVAVVCLLFAVVVGFFALAMFLYGLIRGAMLIDRWKGSSGRDVVHVVASILLAVFSGWLSVRLMTAAEHFTPDGRAKYNW